MSAQVRFYKHPVYNSDKSAEQKRKVFEEKTYIEIRNSKNSSFSRPMTEEDKYKYPEQYSAFLLASGDDVEGTPLRFLPATNSANTLELMEFDIRTVEQLAEAGEEIDGIDGIEVLRRQAKAYLAAMSADEKSAEQPAKRGRKAKDETIEA